MSVLHWEPSYPEILRRPSSTWHMGCKKGCDPAGTGAWHADVGGRGEGLARGI